MKVNVGLQEVSVELWHMANPRQVHHATSMASRASDGSQEVFLGRAPLRLDFLAHSQVPWLLLPSAGHRIWLPPKLAAFG